MQVQLIGTNKSQTGQVFSVGVPEFRIGRAKDSHLRSNSSKVSRQHCVISTHDDTVKVERRSGNLGGMEKLLLCDFANLGKIRFVNRRRKLTILLRQDFGNASKKIAKNLTNLPKLPHHL